MLLEQTEKNCNQIVVVYHVNDIKASCVEQEALDKFIQQL